MRKRLRARVTASMLSVLMCVSVLSGLSGFSVFAADDGAGTFQLFGEVTDYGYDAIGVALDFGEGAVVSTDSVTTGKFSVSVGSTDFMGQPTTTPLTVIKAYASTSAEIGGAGVNGRYIILELDYGYNKGNGMLVYGPLTDIMNARNTVVLDGFSVAQSAAVTVSGGSASSDWSLNTVSSIIPTNNAGFESKTAANGLKYQFYEPETTSEGKLPLVLWLHGMGEGGNGTAAGYNGETQILANKGGVGWVEAAADNPALDAFVVAPQAYSSWDWASAREDCAKIDAMLKEIIAANPLIDAGNIYVAGCSMGGGQTYAQIIYSKSAAGAVQFAGAFPICPAYTPTAAEAALIKDIPIWVFQATNDGTVNPDSVREGVNRLIDAGATDLHYTEYENNLIDGNDYQGHWSWVHVLRNEGDVMEWLFGVDGDYDDDAATAQAASPVVTANANGAAVSLSWSSISGATGYNIYEGIQTEMFPGSGAYGLFNTTYESRGSVAGDVTTFGISSVTDGDHTYLVTSVVNSVESIKNQAKAAAVRVGGVPAPELSFGMGGGFGGPAGYTVSIGAPYVAGFGGPAGLISDQASADNYRFYYTTDGSDPTSASPFVQATVMTWGTFGFVMAPSIPIPSTCYVKVVAYDVSKNEYSAVVGVLASTLALTASKDSGLNPAEDYPLSVSAILNDVNYNDDLRGAFYKVETRDASNGRLADTAVTITAAVNDGAYILGTGIAIPDPGVDKATVIQVYADVEIEGSVYPLTALYWYTSKAGLVKLSATNVPQVVSEMYLADKIDILSGVGTAVAGLANTGVAGATLPLPAYGIPGIGLSDGPTGVRMGSNATVWTNPTGIAATWNIEAAKAIADRVGAEATAYGADYMLGPALNIQRNPLGGRDFEYYSEDPYVSGITAGYYTQALQERGVGATLKHYAANNQEQYRSGGVQYISERALREIYLRGFELAVDIGDPWSVMSSYNRPNGIYASANTWLLTKVLRDDFGFTGFVMTDWGGAHDPAESWVISQNDLAEPSFATAGITAWVNDNSTELTYDEKVALIDRNVTNILKGIVKTHTFKGDFATLTSADVAALSSGFADKSSQVYKDSVTVNRETAAEAMVLLKNEANTLPLAAAKKVAIVNTSLFEGGGMSIGGGSSYGDMIVEGGGSANVTFAPGYTVDFKAGFENAGYTVVDDVVTPGVAITSAKAAELAAASDYGVYVISRPSSEGADNTQASFDMYAYETASYNALVAAFHAVGKPVIVLINCGASINVQAFKASADAVLVTWLPGTEGGNALLDILTGDVNPSGKLAQSFPLEYNDSPSIAMAKAAHAGNTWSSDPEYYDEGVYVGYRYFTTFGKEDRVAYPFGYGLSYTTFSFSNLSLNKKIFTTSSDSETLTASVTVKNTGAVAGQEVVQLYLGADSYQAEGRPVRELKAYAKTKLLQPGESEVVSLTIGKRDLQYFNDGNPDNDLDSPIVYATDIDALWTVAPGTVFTLTVGDSSATTELNSRGVSDTFVYKTPTPANELKLNAVRVSASLKNKTVQANVTTDADAGTLRYESSNPGIFTVNDSGLITLKRSGTALLRVVTTDGSNLSASAVVVVTP
ncbi:MAG: glycoside hydrolase family 3 C-terminal domain-containing protein [Clostridiales Family XIII bacterium]|nr:glycoside hydrolase family 3 C-terminal domain-containing protein [Clostridiales Family XIII bacterium]